MKWLTFLTLFGLIGAAESSHAEVVAHGWDDFYIRSDYGKLGIIETPFAATPSITVLSPGVTVTRKQSDTTWFVLNHLDRDATHNDMAPTYVGVLVIIARNDKKAVGKSVLAIHRNSGWVRDYCWRPDCFDPNGTDANYSSSQQLYKCTSEVMGCVASTRSQERETSLDDLLETQLDGQVDGAPDLDTWNRRDIWSQPQLAARVGCSNPHIVCEFENILLKFVPSAGRPHMQPLKHYFDSSLAISTVIYTYSPTEIDFQNVYQINYTQ